MGNGMSQVLPGLFLGSFADAKDAAQLSKNKITHIISIHDTPQTLLQGITYLRIPLPDAPEVPIKQHFQECVDFIHGCRLAGGNCLVHCMAGVSRSATVVTAYIMAVSGLGWEEALEAVRGVRPSADPNPGFREQLRSFGRASARKMGQQLQQRYGPSTFDDEGESLRREALRKSGGEGDPPAVEASPGGPSTPRPGPPFLLRLMETCFFIPRSCCRSRREP
ncbi:dual specificity protein phosphatase 15 [Tachyglossus aculeatus]|uniref:dual specificity protein phosphatase 15 n=1 Tax=Tachyglossus aculeatus TaxID=9261 RepID=UPI0018F4F0DA|nr:dual specificity protein phosphatase 15 [Tachyglossus aculeatus]